MHQDYQDNIIFIYCLKDPNTLEIRYIGKTNNPKRRYLQHLSNQRLGNGRQPRLYNWLKSIKDKPIFEIIFCSLKDNVDEMEKFFIKKYSNLVNLTIGGDGGQGFKHSLETKLKMSQDRKGEKSPLFGIKKSKETILNFSKAAKNRKNEHLKKYNKEKSIKIIDQFGTIYNSISEASRKLNIHKSNISKVVCGKYKQASNYIFKKVS